MSSTPSPPIRQEDNQLASAEKSDAETVEHEQAATLETPVVKLSPHSQPTSVLSNSSSDSAHASALPSTAQMEAVMRVNPFAITFRQAAQQGAQQRATITMLEQSPAVSQSPSSLTSAQIASLLMMTSDNSGNTVETPDVIRQAMARGMWSAHGSTSNAGQSTIVPQTADIVSRLLELQREDSVNNSTVNAALTSETSTSTSSAQSTSSTNVHVAPVPVPARKRSTRRAEIKNEPSSNGNSFSEPTHTVEHTHSQQQQPVMISFQVGDQRVELPIQVSVGSSGGTVVMSTHTDTLGATTLSYSAPNIHTSSSHHVDYLSTSDSRECSMSPTHRHGHDNSGRTSPHDRNRRQDILERNREAAVRYRKRKRAEQETVHDHVQRLEKDKMTLEARVSVLQRELDTVNSTLRSHQMRCTCAANAISSNQSNTENDNSIDPTSLMVTSIMNQVTNQSYNSNQGTMLLMRDSLGRNILIPADTFTHAPSTTHS